MLEGTMKGFLMRSGNALLPRHRALALGALLLGLLFLLPPAWAAVSREQAREIAEKAIALALSTRHSWMASGRSTPAPASSVLSCSQPRFVGI